MFCFSKAAVFKLEGPLITEVLLLQGEKKKRDKSTKKIKSWIFTSPNLSSWAWETILSNGFCRYPSEMRLSAERCQVIIFPHTCFLSVWLRHLHMFFGKWKLIQRKALLKTLVPNKGFSTARWKVIWFSFWDAWFLVPQRGYIILPSMNSNL